jgi:nitroimidazol reductase NimA-like FMN-containing flavoprotein (pyridoxamine 5'-phosphate oxidase superfamily)
MQKVTKVVRDIELIENELNAAPAGILAFNIDNEKTVQTATTFLYLDKNIYIFFTPGDELFEKLLFNSFVSFAIIRNDKTKKQVKTDFSPVYNTFSITVSGTIRKIDEEKLIKDVKENYLKKYSRKFEPHKKNISSLGEVVIIDTEEIHAYEETGG